MKKIALASALVFASSAAFAVEQAPMVKGGFTGPNVVSHTTAKAALNAADDEAVVLTGYIINSLGNEEYTFKDATGEIIIEIDDEEWHGLKATPETKLVIHGEADKDWADNHSAVDVSSVKLAK